VEANKALFQCANENCDATIFYFKEATAIPSLKSPATVRQTNLHFPCAKQRRISHSKTRILLYARVVK